MLHQFKKMQQDIINLTKSKHIKIIMHSFNIELHLLVVNRDRIGTSLRFTLRFNRACHCTVLY